MSIIFHSFFLSSLLFFFSFSIVFFSTSLALSAWPSLLLGDLRNGALDLRPGALGAALILNKDIGFMQLISKGLRK